MSVSKSWLTSPSPPKSRLLSASSHELPRWRTPSPMAASMIPPPIVQSRSALPSEPLIASTVIEKLSPFEERQQDIQADLQFLLDAQAEGLIRGLEGGSLDDRSSTGSTTPTVQSVGGISVRRQRKPTRRHIGLRSARKGIYKSLLVLSSLKDEELEDVDEQVRDNQVKLDQIRDWEVKRKGLAGASGDIDSGGETVRVQRLRGEAESLQAEINQVELQLADMRTRHRQLLKKAAAVENVVQAKLASYTSSLRLLEDDIQKFLTIRPIDRDAQPVPKDGKLSVWQLPAKRRNLEMAQEYWSEQRELSLDQRKEHQHEKDALVEGANLWRDAVTEITDFEHRLRGGMASLRPSSPSSQSAWDDPPDNTTGASAGLTDLLQDMDNVLSSLESKCQIAEERNWRLLIAALGAECDALKRGKEILTGVSGIVSPALVDTNGNEQSTSEAEDKIHEMEQSFDTTRPLPSRTVSDGDDHDEPDPELLFSRQDADTD